MLVAKRRKPAQSASRGVVAVTAAERDRALAHAAGAGYAWHYGTLRGLGAHPAGRSAEVVWDEGVQSDGAGNVSDDAWDVLRLAFETTRRIRVLSALPAPAWAFDFQRVHVCSL
jgi:hypothetical protein